jgi:hypothetical protein
VGADSHYRVGGCDRIGDGQPLHLSCATQWESAVNEIPSFSTTTIILTAIGVFTMATASIAYGIKHQSARWECVILGAIIVIGEITGEMVHSNRGERIGSFTVFWFLNCFLAPAFIAVYSWLGYILFWKRRRR